MVDEERTKTEGEPTSYAPPEFAGVRRVRVDRGTTEGPILWYPAVVVVFGDSGGGTVTHGRGDG